MDDIRTASGASFEDVLEEMKGLEFDKSLLLVLDDDMVKMIAAWPVARRIYIKRPLPDPDLPEIWGNVGFFMSNWTALANVSESNGWRVWKTIVTHGMIYPDGTLPKEVSEYLITRVDVFMGK